MESIVDDTIDQNSKRKWRFRVRWKGYDESNDIWLSWDLLKHVGILHGYLRSQGQMQSRGVIRHYKIVQKRIQQRSQSNQQSQSKSANSVSTYSSLSKSLPEDILGQIMFVILL